MESHNHITPREHQVLRLLCEGYTSKQIAKELTISFKTATCHRSRLLEKAGVKNTVLLLRWAMRYGYIPVDSREQSQREIDQRPREPVVRDAREQNA